MNIEFTPSAWDDYVWFQTNDRQLLRRINQLIKESSRTPFTGTGKPEPLKANLSGYWSRRIDSEHRLVYRVSETSLIIVSCRFHYDK
ncbi:MAG: Txe/YoeB family addiction module toxin [Ardenticatenaceae bacterium]|nr:Txe/YoeB family addiction module toxin [Ardenticatenaceae bacterium]